MIIYQESMDIYHANPAMGSGDIRDFMRAPRLFRDRMDGLLPAIESDAMAFGTAFHCAVLEPTKFADNYAVKPEGMSFATKEGKAWREEHEGSTIISAKDKGRIDFMILRMPGEARAFLVGGRSEVTFRVDFSGFAVQCRADHISNDFAMMADLKTISAIEKVEKEVFARGYHIQARWYQRIVERETGKLPEFRLVFCESAPPYRWRIVSLDGDYLNIADEKIDEAFSGIAACEKSGEWPDHKPLLMHLTPPPWLSGDEFTINEDGISL